MSGVIRMRARPLPLLLALALPLAASRAAAQVGTTTDIITGTVIGPDSQPLAGALVQAVSLETQISRHADRKSTRLNSSHDQISYAVFCLKKKKKKDNKR